MKKIFSFALAAFALLSMTACGGGSKDSDSTETTVNEEVSYKVKPEATRVNGALSDLFEVVDKEYTLTKDGMSYVINVDFTRTEAKAPYDVQDIDDGEGYGSDASMLGGIGIEMLDENGNVIFTVDPDDSECLTLLRSTSGDTVSVKFKTYGDINGTPTSFRITSDLQPNKNKSTGSASSSSSSSDDSSSSSYDDDDDDDLTSAANKMVDKAKQKAEEMMDDYDLDDVAEQAGKVGKAAKAAKAAYDLYKSL